MKLKIKELIQKKQKGQIMVIAALAFIGLIAIIGLAIDLGMVYVNYSRLRQAADAAALAATGEMKRGYTITQIRNAANEMLALQGFTADEADELIDIQTCDSYQAENGASDPQLCTTPARKIVRVRLRQNVPLYFLNVLGIRQTPIAVDTLAEAASLDMVLVIDTSESMTYNAEGNLGYLDPHSCNQPATDPGGAGGPTGLPFDEHPGDDGLPGDCHPFEEVKYSAKQFVEEVMVDGYDRVGIVTFDQLPDVVLPLSSSITLVTDTIKNLKVYEASVCPWPVAGGGFIDPITKEGITTNMDTGAPCRGYYEDGTFYERFLCPNYIPDPDNGNPSKCGSTNIGGGLRYAGNMLAGSYPPGVTLPLGYKVNSDSVWVVVLLTDGAANAAFKASGQPICPNYTWSRSPFCRDKDPSEATGRHDEGDVKYDADDYARDMVDFVAKGQEAYLFAIGLGKQVPGDGEALLTYAAGTGGTEDPYIVITGSELEDAFLKIANKISSKLNQ